MSDTRKPDAATVNGELTEEQLNSVSGGDNKTTTKIPNKPEAYLPFELSGTLVSG
jgi:bacteriocin-like protein